MKNLRDKRTGASFVFSYCYGSLVPGKENFVAVDIIDDEIIQTHILPVNSLSSKSNNDSFKKDIIKTKKLEEYLLLDETISKLNEYVTLRYKDLKISKSSYKKYIHIKLNNREYNLEGNATNKEYINFFNELVEHASEIIGFDKDENVSNNDALINKISEINDGDFFLDELVKNFIEGIGITSIDAIKDLDKLSTHKDIYNEFTKYLMKKEFPTGDCVNIEGYKAKDIHRLGPLLDAMEVYNLMVYLRENPVKAKQIITTGFPQK